MIGMAKADDIFSSLVDQLDNVVVDRDRAVSIVTYGAPSMIGRKTGVVVK